MTLARMACSDSVVNVCAKRSRFGPAWGSARRFPVRTKATDRTATPNHFPGLAVVRIPSFENETSRRESSDGLLRCRVKKMKTRRSEGCPDFPPRRDPLGCAEPRDERVGPGREVEKRLGA